MRAARTAWTVSGTETLAGASPSDPAAVPTDEDAAVHELPDELFEEERVSLGTLDNEIAKIVREGRGEQLVEHARHVLRRERIEPERRHIPPAGSPVRAAVEQLRPRVSRATTTGA